MRADAARAYAARAASKWELRRWRARCQQRDRSTKAKGLMRFHHALCSICARKFRIANILDIRRQDHRAWKLSFVHRSRKLLRARFQSGALDRVVRFHVWLLLKLVRHAELCTTLPMKRANLPSSECDTASSKSWRRLRKTVARENIWTQRMSRSKPLRTRSSRRVETPERRRGLFVARDPFAVGKGAQDNRFCSGFGLAILPSSSEVDPVRPHLLHEAWQVDRPVKA